MKIINRANELIGEVKVSRAGGKRIGFVPTMGNLHDGHLALVKEAQKRCDQVVVSIFVNPLQFGANEDLDSYPRTLEADITKLQQQETTFLFCPTTQEMYPSGTQSQTLISVPNLSNMLCGASRPGHFTGVATVVCKLFNIVRPDIAIFGLKDFQQLAVIRQMVADLCIDIEIVGAPIVRAEDGLALSSRNGYLSLTERSVAPTLYECLLSAKQAIENGEKNFSLIEEREKQKLIDAGMRPNYFSIRDSNTLMPAECYQKDLVIIAAAYLGNTRLIDNVTLSLKLTEV